MALHTRVKEEHSVFRSLRVCGLPRILIKAKSRLQRASNDEKSAVNHDASEIFLRLGSISCAKLGLLLLPPVGIRAQCNLPRSASTMVKLLNFRNKSNGAKIKL